MALKTNETATLFSQKKLLGKAHTSNFNLDVNEAIGSNVQTSTGLVFGEAIPDNPSLTLHQVQSSTVEYIEFALVSIAGSTYDANDSGGGAGSDSGESSQVSGPHAYAFKFKSNYQSVTNNPLAGDGNFNNDKIVHETLGSVQLIPPFYSREAVNPYIIKIYKDDGSGDVGDEIPVLDDIDWQVDTYNGVLFVQDYNASKIPAHARAFAYVGSFADFGKFANGLSGSLTQLTDGKSYLVAGDNITITSASNGQITISSTATGGGGGSAGPRDKKSYNVSSQVASGSVFNTSTVSYTDAGFNPSLIDVFLNGQLMLSGTDAQVGQGAVDYFVNSDNTLKFGFDLQIDDIVNVVVSATGSGEAGTPGGTDTQVQFNDGGTLNGDSGLVFNKTSNTLTTNNISGSLTKLSDGTSYIIAGNSISIASQSNGSILISAPNSIFNEYVGEADGSNTRFTLDRTPTENKNVSVFVNGQLQMPATDITGAPFQDFSVTGSVIFFVTASLPPDGSLLMANYTTNQSIS